MQLSELVLFWKIEKKDFSSSNGKTLRAKCLGEYALSKIFEALIYKTND
ncbi:hypothetical protein EV13_2714 [Prochlorococcus sp. MIT 0702]|nr:hypothetical protein EV12_2662 [Prochlorococcus sp. MIT 0701]KGG25940.1 hypothetical protein EV13_2714 [Prochlorococcus sp. MIT 0702]KGG30885.1 hypothetical protein EV14_2824 [Prochlorococcus sp. MIT 0703]